MTAMFCRMMTLFAVALLMILTGGMARAETVAAGARAHLAMRLVAESAAPPVDGGTVTIALEVVPEKGWHGYWSNPGDAGFPASFAWTLPNSARVSAPRWPVPTTLVVAGLMNYVYERPYALLFQLTLPKGATGSVSMHTRYLVCTDRVCVPEEQTLILDWWRGEGAAASFAAWRRALPRPLDAAGTYQVEAGAVRLAVPYPADAPLADAYFYPAASGVIDMAAPQTVTRSGDRITIETKAPATAPAGRIDGVLAIGEGQGLSIAATPGTVARPGGNTGWGAALAAFAAAVLGGLILNVMPCVFPILSLKALSLARSGATEGAARAEALAYTAGVVAVCLALGGALLALRAGGATLGWAFQLQDPRVIGVLLLLVTGIALNLAGLFELPTPRFAGEHGAGGAFVTGALAAFVATPCTGPFMGAALGAALVLPPAAAMLVFGGLGLGIALPFLALGFVPALRKRLPRPGAWMARLRHVLAVPMLLTALALAWVLGRQAGVDGMTIGLAALLVASVGLWWTGRRQIAGQERAWLPAIPALVLAVAAVSVVRPAPAAASVAAGEPFSEARLAALRRERRPVFAYFTADWCLTCKVNEAAAMDRGSVRDAFRRHEVAVLVGDWTDGDPVLGRFIERHNRAGVPLYLYYAPGAATPRVLPQLLTPAMLEALGG